MYASLTDALAERGYDTLTPVQEAVSDPALAGADLLVSAQTGSGKTVGFGLAIAPTLLNEAGAFGPAGLPAGLIVAPTRELAFQVRQELSWLYARTGAVLASCVGGMDARNERRALERGAHIVVGTPGRLRDHIERGALDLSALQAVVLDEADEMLDLGFREDLEFILGSAAPERRTLLFSATVPPAIGELAKTYQRDARRVVAGGGARQHADIAYQAVRVAAQDAEHAIFNLLRYHHDQGAIVFANTRAAVNHLTARLGNRGFATVCLSGELSQTERTHALQAMRDGRARICVATDVAARGIDLPNLNLVIHADLPTNTESLLHRSGRTGRAGRKGISALIVPPRATGKAERLLKWAKISAEWTTAPSAEDIQRADEDRLLADPAWDEPVTDEQASFAARLLDTHDAQTIAAAYLRLYQSRHAAPEELLPPDTKPEKRAPRDFGPSRWVSLSVGRKDGAEPRWLLPLLCRAGGIDKAAIGAIRVQDTETFVELSEASVGAFQSGLGSDGVLEKDITARVLDTAPDLGRPPAGRPDRAPRTDMGGDRAPRPERKPRRVDAEAEGRSNDDAPRAAPVSEARAVTDAPADSRPERPKKVWTEKPSDGPRRSPRARDDDARPAKPGKKPYRDRDGGPSDKPRGKPKPRSADGERPKRAYGDAPKRAADDQRKRPSGDKPKRAFDDRPKRSAEDRPKRAAGESAPARKPAPPKADARDTSKRFTPPGAKPTAKGGAGSRAGKPASGGPRKPGGPVKSARGGESTPRRPKPGPRKGGA